MFTSPAPSRRRIGEGSIRSSRASTPGLVGRSTTPRVTASTPLAKGSKGSLARRRNSIRSVGSVLRDTSFGAASSAGGGDDSFEGDTTVAERRRTRRRSAGALGEGTTLSRDDNHAVSTFTRLPNEVITLLQSMSAYDPLQSHYDLTTGFAYLVTSQQCLVWNFGLRAYDAPTCFSYPIPSTGGSSQEALASCALVPKGANREPGLLLLTADGRARYGDSVSNAMGTERQQETTLALGIGESVTTLHRCTSTLYVATTTQARLIGIRLVASGGRLQPIVAPFAQPKGLFGRFFGVAASLTTSGAGIVGLASHLTSDGDATCVLYAITSQSLQKWHAIEGRSERLLFDEELRSTLQDMDERISEGSHAAESVKLVDVATTKDGHAVVLYSFSLVEEGSLHFGLAQLPGDASDVRMLQVSPLSFSQLADVRAYTTPRLVLPHGGPVLFVVFAESVVFRLLDNEAWEETIELRDVSSNRFIGLGAHDVAVKRSDGEPARLCLLTQRSGGLVVEVDVEASTNFARLLASDEDRNVIDTHQLKTRLERGIFHSENALNPISFDLPLDVRGDLIAAAEQLSDDIVRSESASLAQTLDMRIQLANRLERLHSLATFLSLNGMMNMLTQNSLRRLCADAQLIAAGIDLWDYLNELMSTPGRVQEAGDPLSDAIHTSLKGQQIHDDVVRHFFRFELRRLPEVLVHVHEVARQASTQGIGRQSSVRFEANRAILTAFQAALRYRSETMDLYRLDQTKIAFEAWTCTADDVRILRESFADTLALVRERTRQMGNAIDREMREIAEGQLTQEQFAQQMQMTLKGQIFELASHTLDAYEERLAYLALAGSGHPSLERELSTLRAEVARERRNLLLPLVSIGRADRAFLLAEQHGDFDTLTELCDGLPATQRTVRIRTYLDRYGEPFAFALYTFYAQRGQMRTLLEQDESHFGLLARFLDAHPSLNRVAWLHDLAIDDRAKASRRLLVEAQNEKANTSAKKLMLSLAKLGYASGLDELQIATQSEQATIESFDDQIDLVNVHERIRKVLLARSEDDEEANEAVHEEEWTAAAELASTELVATKPAHGQLFRALSRSLFEDRVLSSEDLVDLLTLHDRNASSASDFALALEVFVRQTDMPPARAQTALASLWRRVILADDWASVTQTSGTSDATLQARLRGTALYTTLLSAAGNESTAAAVLAPSDTTVQPTVETVQARLDHTRLAVDPASLPALPTVDSLLEENGAEVEAVERLLTAVKLPQWFEEIRRLVEEALANETQAGLSDLAMD